MMKMLLKKLGMEAATAETGRVAVDMVSLSSSNPYQLVLMDNVMPDMVGSLKKKKLLFIVVVLY